MEDDRPSNELPLKDAGTTLGGMTDVSGLKVTSEGATESCDATSETEMADDPRLEQAFALIREVIADERARTISDMLKGANAPSATGLFAPKSKSSGMSEKARRAPAGSARVLCERTLAEVREGGLTVMKIHEMAANEYEQMLSISAVRNELTVGEKSHPPRYRHVGGVWYLAKYAPIMKVVG